MKISIKTSTLIKEGLLIAVLLGAMIFFAGVGLVSYADASIVQVQDKSVELKQMESGRTVEQAQTISQALDHYRLSLAEARRAKSGVMVVYLKIEAADSMMHAIKLARLHDPLLTDDLEKLAVPKNISVLVNNKAGQDKSAKLKKVLVSVESKASESRTYEQHKLAAK